jgi:hypothetical protein
MFLGLVFIYACTYFLMVRGGLDLGDVAGSSSASVLAMYGRGMRLCAVIL